MSGPNHAQAAIADPPYPTRRQAYYSLAILTVVVMFSTLDRTVMALLIDPIKHDFKLSDTQIAFLIGAAFSITYGIAGIPIARIADSWNRRNLIAISIGVWGFCTMTGGLAQNYAGLIASRLGIGIGESGYGPASWSIVADSFPREKVAFGVGVLAIGAMLGIGLASFCGGAILALVRDVPPIAVPMIGIIRPWQWVFIIVGLPGFLWAFLVMTTHEPARRGIGTGRPAPVPVKEVLRVLRDDWRTWLATIGGAGMKILLAAGQATWGATFFHRRFHWDLSTVGMISGGMTLLVSPLATIVGGKISEYWTKRGRPDANLRIVVYGLIASVPLWTLSPLLPNPWMVLACNACAIFVGTIGMGPGFAAIQIVAPPRIRAQISSLSQFSTNVIAFALSPLIVAMFTDYVFRDPAKLGLSIALNAATMGVIAILITWQGLKPYARACARAERGWVD